MLRALAKPLGLQISKSATAVAARFAGVPERQLLHKHDSLFTCANADFLDAEFDKWVEDPASVESSMGEFFEKVCGRLSLLPRDRTHYHTRTTGDGQRLRGATARGDSSSPL